MNASRARLYPAIGSPKDSLGFRESVSSILTTTFCAAGTIFCARRTMLSTSLNTRSLPFAFAIVYVTGEPLSSNGMVAENRNFFLSRMTAVTLSVPSTFGVRKSARICGTMRPAVISVAFAVVV